MAAPAQPTPKKRPLLMVMLIGAMLVVEAVVIVGVVMVIGQPAEVAAGGDTTRVDTSEEDRIVEILVLDSRLPNNRSGITQVFDTEIYVQVKRKFQTRVSGELDQFRNEIRAEITAIWRTSDPQHFQEPKLENLTRKVYALLNGRFGRDTASGEPIISKSVIVMGTGLRIDT